MSESRQFTVREAARLARVPERSVNFWSGPAKVLVPEVAFGGRGSRKLFSTADLVRLRVAWFLTQRWIALRTVRAAVKPKRVAGWFDPFTTAFGPAELLVLGSRGWNLHSGGVLSETGIPTAMLEDVWDKDIAPSEDAIIIINLTSVKAEIRRRLWGPNVS